MSLPVNIEELVNGHSVEWERLEFKKGWNPEKVVHSMCAFANDLGNWGGGYIIVGIDEDNGLPILPPEGVELNQIDKIQKGILNLSHQIVPNYFPKVQPVDFQGKQIIVIWCYAGDHRVYTAPKTLGNKSQRYPYIRVGSSSIIAKDSNLERLNDLSAKIPFDDRLNQRSSISDLSLMRIQSYLQDVNSNLFKESQEIPFDDLCRAMHIVKGPDEDLHPVNVGLLFFSKQPEVFFSRAWIEVVWYKTVNSRVFNEYYFKGPLQNQLRDVFSFLKTNILGEKTIKYPDRAEADRFYNFPFEALEEAISNAVYHKSYEIGSPIEIQVWPDKITILSHPGSMPPVTAKVLSENRRIFSRVYRNRRIGDFLKELGLTEGRGGGFPTIYEALEANGSPKPIFETDEESYFLTTIPVHPDYLNETTTNDQVSNQANSVIINNIIDVVDYCNQVSNQVSNQASNQVNDQASDQVKQGIRDVVANEIGGKSVEIISFIGYLSKSRQEIFEHIKLTNQSKNRKRYIDPLIDYGFISFTIPETPNDPNQRYKLTDMGKVLNEILSAE